MNCRDKILLLLLLTSLLKTAVFSQQPDTSRISVSFENAKMSQFVDAIERQTEYFFYYDIRQLDTLIFNFSLHNASLSDVLNRAFGPTEFAFAIDPYKHIFISKEYAVRTYVGPANSVAAAAPKKSIARRIADSVEQHNVRSTFGAVQTLSSVTVSAATNVKGTQMGVQKIDIKAVRQVPLVFGEADVLRVVMAMPGVKTVGEASTGLNVRGGSADQNLILFNDATIFNPSHFFGLFSTFNPDIVKDVTLYKSSMPARYGGRLSSVLDIAAREGNKKNITGSAGIGPVTSRIALEGPIIKDKTSFLIGGRSTYANWLMNLLPTEFEDSKANFYDANIILNHTLGPKSELTLTGYLSHDKFSLNRDTVYAYDNKSVSLNWKVNINKSLNAVFAGGVDDYRYNIHSTQNPVNAYSLDFTVNQKYLKAHFNYYAGNNQTIDFGWNSIYYSINPGRLGPAGDQSEVANDAVQRDRGIESALYVNDKFDISTKLSLEAGVRFSLFNYIGPRSVNVYTPGQPKEEETIVDTAHYGKGKFIKTYGGPEYRASLRYAFAEKYSVKFGFNTTRQYIHLLSNTAAMAPTDTWKLSDPNIRPQAGTQYSIGFYRNFKSNTIELSLEFYYKTIKDYLDYKSGANLIMNHHIETDVINTKGKAYGAEFLIKKAAGKFNGWLGYTYSRILLKQDDPNAGEIINQGEYYPANYDKPHDFTFIGNYRVNQRFNVSLNANYSTGRPITLPIGRYYYSNGYRTLYGARNGYRIPDYFRMDFSMNIEGNHKLKQKTHNSWTFGVYNFTGRKNPYSVYYVTQDGVINGYKLSIFGNAIPFVTYNIRF
jgi:hypothetical protein